MAPKTTKTPEEIREAANIRQRNKRERDKLAKKVSQSFTQVEEIDAAKALENHERDLAWATEFDATGNRYKSECRTLTQLLAIYEGADLHSEDDEDEEDIDTRERAKKKAKKKNIPKPFAQPIKIRAIELEDNSLGDDLKVLKKIDPVDFEYRTLKGDLVNLKKFNEVEGIISFRRWLDLRDKGRKNIFWLGRLLGCSLFHNTHQMICDMFVKKDFDGLYFDEYTRDDMHEMIGRQKRVANDGETPTRTMLLFAPRSGYKSTIDGIDCVQWMLNNPDTRIMIMTSVKSLAKMFMLEIKGYFYLTKNGIPSSFQLLYPEYVLTGVAGKSKEPIVCPAQMFRSKEAHVWITSMDASSVGSRCDIRKMDDVVEDKNSADDELRESLKEKIKATNNLVEGWGFTDIIGTRYFTKDWYGWRMSKDEHGNDPEPFSYLSISAWTPKPEFKALHDQLLKTPNGIFQITEKMVDLWFPYKLHWRELQTKLRENKERGFKNQQLNIATDPVEIDNYINQFDMDSLRKHSYGRNKAPKELEIIQSWDTAYSDKRTSDYSVGCTLGIYKQEGKQPGVVIIEVLFGKWKMSELAFQMLDFHKRHRPSCIYIEDANGTGSFMDGDLKIASSKYGSDIANFIRKRPISNKPNAKRSRIMDLEFLLADDRLWFVNGDWIDETFKQLTEYKGGKSTAYRKDDIPDSISLGVVSHLPPSALQHNPDPKDVEKEHEERTAKANRQAMYNRMHGSNSPTRPKPIEVPQAAPPRDPRQDLLKKVIGKILPPGMRI